MPLSIPNTTITSTSYTDALTFAGGDVFAWGFFTIANQSAFVQLFEGQRGMAVLQPELFLPPATYPVAGGERPISGIRFRANSLATPLPQVFGSLFYPKEPGVQAGTPFTGAVAASGITGVGLGTIDRNATLIDVTATAAETDIYSFLVPGGTILASGMLRLTLHGDLLSNNGADTFRVRAYFGGTLLYDDVSNMGAGVARRMPWRWAVELENLGVTNSQFSVMVLDEPDTDQPAPASGIGDVNFNSPTLLGGALGLGAPIAIDTSTAQTLRVTVTNGTASANMSWRKRYAILENL